MTDDASRRTLSDFERGLVVGILIGEGSFGGDGKKPQVTLRMHVRHEALFDWLVARFPRSRLYGPYGHGGRSYYQWMARGPALVGRPPSRRSRAHSPIRSTATRSRGCDEMCSTATRTSSRDGSRRRMRRTKPIRAGRGVSPPAVGPETALFRRAARRGGRRPESAVKARLSELDTYGLGGEHGLPRCCAVLGIHWRRRPCGIRCSPDQHVADSLVGPRRPAPSAARELRPRISGAGAGLPGPGARERAARSPLGAGRQPWRVRPPTIDRAIAFMGLTNAIRIILRGRGLARGPRFAHDLVTARRRRIRVVARVRRAPPAPRGRR